MAERRGSDNRLRVSPSKFLLDNGVYSSISANSHNDVFIVYHKDFISNSMGYRLGKFTELDELRFQEHKRMDHCEGLYPQVAINDDKIVVVTFSLGRNIKYTIGLIRDERKKILWELPEYVPHCEGDNHSIAISGKKVVLVFSKSKDVFYKTGQLSHSSREINWDRECKVDSNACYPTVAMTENAFVVLYQDYLTSRLKTVVGKVQNNPTYKPICGRAQDENGTFVGCYPSVAMFDDCDIITTYQTGYGPFRMLFARSGKVNMAMNTIEWHQDKAGAIIPGAFSSVATVNSAVNGSEKAFVEVHCTNKPLTCTLYYETGRMKDR